MAVERRVTEVAGPPGGRLHTARSRNDQVATDVALFTRDAALGAATRIEDLATALVEAAEAHLDWPLPGYTHLQRAQPVYLSHHLLAYAWMLLRDRARMRFVVEQTALLPLGAGALAGVNFVTDRGAVAGELGFAGVAQNSIDAVSNRDFVLDFLGAASTCSLHLSRLGAEIVLWASEEFGFLTLSDAWSSGSSIMPQKKNPDAAELLRAKAPRVAGHLGALLGVLHALPLTYNKDLQEDKEHLFDAVDTLDLTLQAARGMIATATFHRERMAAAATDELIGAVDLADLLVRKGVPFRSAHGVVAGLVRISVDSGRRLSELTDEEVRSASGDLDRAILQEVLRPHVVAGIQDLGGRHVAGSRPRAAGRGARRPCRLAPAVAVLGPARRRRGQRTRGLHDLLPRRGWRHRGDRGLPRLRGRLPRPHRGHAAQPGALRGPGPDLRLPLLRDPRAAEHRGRTGGRGGGGAHPRAGSPGRAWASWRSGAGARAWRTCARARGSSPRPWPSTSSSTTPPCRTGR